MLGQFLAGHRPEEGLGVHLLLLQALFSCVAVLPPPMLPRQCRAPAVEPEIKRRSENLCVAPRPVSPRDKAPDFESALACAKPSALAVRSPRPFSTALA